MIKKVSIRYDPKRSPMDFVVGSFVIIEHPFRTKRLLPQQLTYWANQLAPLGLIFHSEYDGAYIFRVDGDVIEKLKNDLCLESSTESEYTGGDPLYKDYTKLQLYLDGEPISTVDLS